MIDRIEMLPLSTPAGWLIAFALHATLLLSAVWALERLRLLKHPGWAEWAWRFALFGAFVSVSVQGMSWDALRDDARPAASETAAMARAKPAPIESTAKETTPVAQSQGTAVAAVVAEPSRVASMRPRSSAPVALGIASDAMFAGLMLWLSGTLLLFARMMFQALGLLRLRRRLICEGTAAGADLQRALQTLAQDMDVRMPMLRVLPGLASPLVLPGAVLLPRWAEGLDAPQQRAMLAHELAHLRRRDPLWRPLQRLALVPLFFHPLAWHALRRLETLAETLCDAAAVERSGSGRPLAECLAECLARSAAPRGFDPHNTQPRGAGWALAMAERSGGIVDRVRTLLENSQMNVATIPTRWRWAAAVLAIVALLALIALPGVMVVGRPGLIARVFEHQTLSVTFRKDGSSYTVRSEMPVKGERLRILSDGDVEFNAQESDVVRMGRDAKFEIEQVRGGVRREIAMTPAAGRIRRTYRVDGVERPFDAEGKAWLAAVMPELYRTTGLQAEARSKRLLAEGGVPRLLAEIDLLAADSARADYVTQLFAQATPDDAQTAQAMGAMAKIGSDFEKRRALQVVLSQPRIAAANQAALLAMAADIGSDFERAEWLVEAAPKLPFDGDNAAGWSKALRVFGSDFERKRVLQAAIENGRPQPQAVTLALQSMHGMGSDFEQRSVLESAAGVGAALADADYLAVVDVLGADFEKREALLALIRSHSPDLARSRLILTRVGGIGGDADRIVVLQALAAVMPNDPALIDEYRSVTRRMADFERGQAEKALDRFYRS